MNKWSISLKVVVMLFVLTFASSTHAVNFTVSATIPSATGVSIVATQNQVVGGNEVFGSTVSALNFNPMTFDSVNGIYRSGHFFAIDVGAIGGAGSPNVTVSFGSESNPTGQTKGLGSKAIATFSKVSGGPAPEDQSENTLAAHGPTKLLGQLSGEQVTSTELIGGFLRLRVGIFDGGDATLIAAGGEPFTNGDLPGPYTGILVITGTVN